MQSFVGRTEPTTLWVSGAPPDPKAAQCREGSLDPSAPGSLTTGRLMVFICHCFVVLPFGKDDEAIPRELHEGASPSFGTFGRILSC